MGYRRITTALIAEGRATSQLLWRIVRANFITHDSRLTTLAGTTTVVPPGFILGYAGSTAPTGFLLCDGSAVSRTTYAALFAVISTSYGNPGAAQFNLPDMRGRTIVGNGSGSGLTTRAIADQGGFETHTLITAELPSHGHTVTDPTHTHGGVMQNAGASGYFHKNDLNKTSVTPTKQSITATTGITIQNAGSGTAHNNMQPSTVINFIIKT